MANAVKPVFGVLDLMWLIRDTQLTCNASAKQTLNAIAMRSNHQQNFTCWPTTLTLATDCGCSEDTIERSVKVLSELELIKVTERTRPGKKERDSNLYTVNVTKLRALNREQACGKGAERIAPDDLEGRYLQATATVDDLEEIVKRAAVAKETAWTAWMEKVAADAVAAHARGGLDVVRLPRSLDSRDSGEYYGSDLYRMWKDITYVKWTYDEDGNPQLVKNDSAPRLYIKERRGFSLEFRRDANGDWAPYWEPYSNDSPAFQGMTDAEIDAYYKRQDEEAERQYAGSLIRIRASIDAAGGPEAYLKLKTDEYWERQYEDACNWPRFADATRAEVISILKMEDEYGPDLPEWNGDYDDFVACLA